MATAQGTWRARRPAAEDEVEPAVGIVIWPGAPTDAGAQATSRAPRVRLRELFAPAAAGR